MPFTYECAGCGVMVVKPTRLTRARAFCSMGCYQRSNIKYPDRACPGCGVIFNKRKSSHPEHRPGKPNQTYCTRECFEASVRKWMTCERCGKRFELGRNIGGNRRFRQFCSDDCRWPPSYMNCKTCDTKFRVRPSEDGTRQFCSFACYRRHTGETALEARVRGALEGLGINFEQEYAAGRWSIDFALVAPRVAIEADGEYWHTVTAERDAKRDVQLSRAGWRIVRLSENDVNDARDVGAFILDQLRGATGLELADLTTGETVRRPVTATRLRFHLNGRKRARRGANREAVAGQMSLWSDS